MHVSGLTGENPDVSNWPHPAAPDANPFPRSTASAQDLAYREAKANLGKVLFWDEQVSTDNTVSCGTCHFNSAGGTDDRLGAVASNGAFGAFGTIPQRFNNVTNDIEFGYMNPPSTQIARDVTGLHTPTMIGAYVFDRLFWDMRAGPDFSDELGVVIPNFADWAALEDLSTGPPISPVEMAHEGILWSDNSIQTKLNGSFPLALVDPTTIPADIQWLPNTGAAYKKIFDKIFFNDPQFGGFQGVTRERFAMAVATYMRTLIPDKAPIDTGNMSSQMVHGFKIMHVSGCFNCHSTSGNPQLTQPGGVLADPFDNPMSDGRFHNIGFGVRKTPTLRNVGLRKKFFSHGMGNLGNNSLPDIVKFYANQTPGLKLNGSGPGGNVTNVEFDAVVAFLDKGLTDKRVALMAFPFDQPELASERSDYNPFEGNEYGTASVGSSGTVPEIIANAVPVVDAIGSSSAAVNPFKVGLGNALPLTTTILLTGPSQGSGPNLLVGGPINVSPPVQTTFTGIATVQMPVNLTPGAIGIPFFCQWLVLEPGVASWSNAAEFNPFMF